MIKRTISKSTIASAWENSLSLFFQPSGVHRYDSRGDPCLEIEDLFFDIQHPSRKPQISPLFPKALVPFIDSFTKRLIDREIGQISNINDRMYRWQKRDGGNINQLDKVINMLRTNPGGRYSLIGFWDPEIELFSEKQIGPIMAYPRIRSGELTLTVVTRSLDAITGAVQLIVGFANFQSYLAETLNATVGPLRVLALSYHLLDMDLPRVMSLLKEKKK